MKFKRGDKIVLIKAAQFSLLKHGDIRTVQGVQLIDGIESVLVSHTANSTSWWPASCWEKFVENKEELAENISLWDSVAE